MSGEYRVTLHESGSEQAPITSAARDKTIVPLAAFDPQASILRARTRGLPDSALAGEAVFSICVHVDALPRICPKCCVGLTAKMVQPYESDVDALNRFIGSMPQVGMNIRCLGPGCAHCNGIGTVGIKYLVEAHGITAQTVDAANSNDWSNPGWMEDLNEHVTRGKPEAIPQLVGRAAAAGEVDFLRAFELVGVHFR
jgi:hypothetical protein